MTLTIIGLGPGHIDDVTRRAWTALEAAPTLIVRTAEHPCVAALPNQANMTACDDLYESISDFAGVYSAIADRVLAAAALGDVAYAVPGDPMNAEATVKLIRARAAEVGITVEVISGISFIEPALALVNVDALDGLQLFDGITLAQAHHPPINPDIPALIGQVFSRDLASNLKLTLMNQYPDDFSVMLIHAAGTPEAIVEITPLYRIDRSASIRHLTALYLPALGSMSSFERAQEVIAHLRAPEGCSWDQKQTHLSLRPFLIEEAYEVIDAINADDPDNLREELGDLLLQVLLHTQIATEEGEFRMADVIHTFNEKMIRRHPHVWSDPTALGLPAVDGAEQVVANWETLKQRERAAKGLPPKRASILDGVPKAMPALLQALEFQKKAAKVGFDWAQVQDVLDTLLEEIEEVKTAPTDEERRKEMGDLLFSVVNWARWFGIDPEDALRTTNAKFSRRFGHIEATATSQDRDLKTLTMAEMEALWIDAKHKEL